MIVVKNRRGNTCNFSMCVKRCDGASTHTPLHMYLQFPSVQKYICQALCPKVPAQRMLHGLVRQFKQAYDVTWFEKLCRNSRPDDQWTPQLSRGNIWGGGALDIMQHTELTCVMQCVCFLCRTAKLVVSTMNFCKTRDSSFAYRVKIMLVL
jgi:hypothetical protein